jgi:hypothetical protein
MFSVLGKSLSPLFSSSKHTLLLKFVLVFPFLARRLFQGTGRDDIPLLFDTRKMQLHTHNLTRSTKERRKERMADGISGGLGKRNS